MDRLFGLFKRDLKAGIREFLLLYLMIIPFILAIGLKLFLPQIGEMAPTYAVMSDVPASFVEVIGEHGEVEAFTDADDFEKRILAVDDVLGFRRSGSEILITREGGESEAQLLAARHLLTSYESGGVSLIPYEDLGETIPMTTIYAGSAMLIMTIVLGGMLIGLGIIEDKEQGTIAALMVTPLRRFEYILGKALIGVFIPLAESFLILWILGTGAYDPLQLFAMLAASCLVTVLFGFLIGVMSPNQIAGIANMKFLLLLVSASYLGAILLPTTYHWTLYWSPLYWSTMGLNAVLEQTASWATITGYSIVIMGLSFLLFFALRGKIARKLLETS